MIVLGALAVSGITTRHGAHAAADRRFGGTNRTPWSRTPPWPHRDENRTGRDNAERGH
jgi:hypothetical protein